MRHSEAGFTGAGGVDIYTQSWLPDTEALGGVVIAHGVSEHSGRYEALARALVDEGRAVHALDHRGHGRSGGPRAVIDRLDHALADIDSLIGRVGGRPILLGHSMGGCLAIAYALRHQDRLAGLVLSSPLAVSEAATPVVRTVSRLLSALTPRLGVIRLDAGAVSRDADEVRTYETDPLNFHGRLPVRSVAELTGEIDTFVARLPELTLPLLVIHGTDDRLVPVAAGKLVTDLASSADKTLKLYDGAYHELFHELPPVRDRAIADVAAWLRAH